MMIKKRLCWMMLTLLLIIMGIPSGQAQLSKNPDAWINNPLGVKPLYLHFGRGAMYLSALTGIAYYLDRKNKEIEDKRLSFYFENGTMFSYKYPHTLIPETNIGVNYKVSKWLAYGADMGIYFPRDDFNESTGLSMLRIYNKFYFCDNDKFRLWFENGVGVVYFTKTFPKKTDQSERAGTYWNGVVKYGFGSEYNINPFLSVLLGVRHLHFSNADVRGKIRNPSSDSHGIFIGFNYNPRRVSKEPMVQ